MVTNKELAKQLTEILWQRTSEFARTTPIGRLDGEVMVSAFTSLLTSVIVSCPDTATRAEVLRRAVQAVVENTRAWQPPPTPDEQLAALKPAGHG